MAKIKTKKTGPSDICNSADKVIMQTMEKHLPKIPVDSVSLSQHLNISDEHCTYCTLALPPRGGNRKGNGTTDEIIPCKNGGRYSILNTVPSCNHCNQSKSDRFGPDLVEWINNGPKITGKSLVPLKNHMKMINWIEMNTKNGYLKTDDPKITKKRKNVKEMVTCFLQTLYEYCETDDYESSEEMVTCFLQNIYEYCETGDYESSDRENTHVKITHGVSSEFCGEHVHF